MIKIRVWLSYDLGVRGDYTGIYKWLDEQQAVECGDSIATFLFDDNGDIKTAIKESLQEAVDFGKNDRVYLIFKNQRGNYIGSFIIGNRKSSPWEGYALVLTEDDE
jgi:hypothetical protein